MRAIRADVVVAAPLPRSGPDPGPRLDLVDSRVRDRPSSTRGQFVERKRERPVKVVCRASSVTADEAEDSPAVGDNRM